MKFVCKDCKSCQYKYMQGIRKVTCKKVKKTL